VSDNTTEEIKEYLRACADPRVIEALRTAAYIAKDKTQGYVVRHFRDVAQSWYDAGRLMEDGVSSPDAVFSHDELLRFDDPYADAIKLLSTIARGR